MTQEEKAKAYDEVLGRAKSLVDFCSDNELKTLKFVFPELKENEDDRIREGIIRNLEYLMNKSEGFVKDELKERIAWLEKQGESIDKITQRARTEKQRVLLTETNGEANIDWDTRSIQDVKLLLEYGLDYIKKLENQVEQKASYTTIVETGDGGINALVTRELPTDGEQKPAEWSEEDEHWRQKAIGFMKHPDLIKATPTLAKDTINWLTAIR